MPRGVHMTREQKQTARRLAAQGVPLKAIARDLNFSLQSSRSACGPPPAPCEGPRMGSALWSPESL